MKLIRSIEINYFRSIYQFRIKQLRDLNVFVGGNDSGKSNVLRALNLFFNNRVSDFGNIDFLQDVTHSRQSEAKDAKGRLTIWIRITFNNIEGWKSLPETFSVKKVWNRYSGEPEVSYDIENSNNLQRFLNKINFVYVPAVKDNSTYSKYLRVLYETISTGPEIDLGAAASTLSSSVNSAIDSMSRQIEIATGVNSRIDVPSDFRDLFERLSFSTKQDDFTVPLRNRGDGLQARHIPHILEFICSQNKKNNIWAYEEPENSLEMARAFEVSRQFNKDFCQKNQIFVTSHSPAFYGLDGSNVEKYYIKKKEHGDGTMVSSVEKFEDVPSADKQLGIAHVIADRSKLLFQEIEFLKSDLDKIRSFGNPVILTEGLTDKEIFEVAIVKTGRDPLKYNVMCCERRDGEGGGAPALKQTLENMPASEPNLRFGIFDRDDEGRAAFEGLKKFHGENLFADIKKSASGRIFGILLPEVEWDDPYFELSRKQISIEQMFSKYIIGNDLISYRFDAAGGSITRHEVDKLILHNGIDFVKKIVKGKIIILDKQKAKERIIAASATEFDKIGCLLNKIDHYI